jgi:cyclohexadienyl dehydratase
MPAARFPRPDGARRAAPARALRRAILCGLLVAAMATPASADALRVGTSGDYAPFSVELGGRREGFDVAVIEAFAANRGLAIEWVRFAWPDLLAELAAGRFDVAASGITLRSERSLAAAFTLPLAETGAVALVRADARFASLAELDARGVRIAVNRGGHLERVARERLPHADLLPVSPNAAVLDALASGRADAAVSDSAEAVHWQRAAGGLRAIGPFTRDRKAWLVRADRPELVAELDAWLLAREADGSLARWRERHLGAAGPATAEPLAALLAALDERLALMPLVAASKRARGLPLEDLAREARVLDASVESTRRAASLAGRPVPDPESVRGLWRAQIDAAKTVQRAAWDAPRSAPAVAPPDLESALRPALARIDARTARLLLALEAPLACDATAGAAREALRTPALSEAHVRALARGVAAASGARCD